MKTSEQKVNGATERELSREGVKKLDDLLTPPPAAASKPIPLDDVTIGMLRDYTQQRNALLFAQNTLVEAFMRRNSVPPGPWVLNADGTAIEQKGA